MKNLFRGQTISLVTCGLILSSTMSFGADSIDAAFKEGKASGSLGLYGQSIDENSAEDFGYLNGYATIGYETASFYGLTAKAEFRGNLDLGEIEDGDRDEQFANNALMTEAYLKYATEGFFLSAGRQAIDLEWLSDYHEAVVAGITAIPDTTIVLGWTKRKAESTPELSEDFWKINENKGAYVADIKYAGFEGVELNPYYYTAPDVADWYGLKTTFSTDYFGAIAHYAESNVDKEFGLYEDGYIGHVELNTEVAGLSAAAGYIKTDKDGGADIMAIAGDNISPFEDGNFNYSIDAKTIYGSLGYTIADVSLGALYGQTEYSSDNLKEKELNLSAGYSFTESLGASVLYVNVDADSKEVDHGDYDKWIAAVEYTF